MVELALPKVLADVTKDVVRAEALKHDLVDVKIAIVDERWSALTLVVRKGRRIAERLVQSNA